MHLVVLREAAGEFESAVVHYEDKQAGLGQRFRDEVDRHIRSIASFPQFTTPAGRDVRIRCLAGLEMTACAVRRTFPQPRPAGILPGYGADVFGLADRIFGCTDGRVEAGGGPVAENDRRPAGGGNTLPPD